MIRLISFITGVVFSVLTACQGGSSQQEVTQEHATGPAQIEFDTTFYDFGSIYEGEQVAYTFHFTNTGGDELMVLDAYGACGCTVAKYEKAPLKPGKSGKIEVVFDSSNRRGMQYKTVKVKTNSPQEIRTLTIKASVLTNK